MPRKRRSSSPFDPFDDNFDEDASSQSSRNGNPPIQRNAANARERARMRVLSSAFGRLKTKLPNIPADTKLSKLDTLRLATMYIKQLKTIVEGGTPSGENFDAGLILEHGGIFNLQSGSQSMTWPFGFHHIQSSSRQLQFQYSTMDWMHSPEAYSSKVPAIHRDSDTYAQLNSNSANQQPSWYSTEAASADANRAACAYEALAQHDQSQRLMHTHNPQTQQHSQHAPLSHSHPHPHHQQQQHQQQQHQQHSQLTSIR